MSSERCTAAEIKERLPLFGQFARNLLVLRMEPVQIPIPRIVLQGRHVGHVVQQRMKRVGMRSRAPGADAMLALRSLDPTTGACDEFWAAKRVV